jgi:hypothetical protein
MAILACVFAVEAQQTAKPVATDAHVWHMKKAQAIDAIGFGAQAHQVVAYTMLVPVDWTSKLGVYYARPVDCDVSYGQTSLVADSPDKLTGVNVMPVQTTVWTDNQAAAQRIRGVNQEMGRLQVCTVQPLQSFDSRVTTASQRFGTLVGGVEPVPGFSDQVTAAAAQLNAQLQQQAAAQGRPATHVNAMAGRQRVSAMLNGKPVEGWVIVMKTVRAEPLASGGTYYTVQTPLFAVIRAPQGQLDAETPMMMAMLMSIQFNPEWQQALAQATVSVAQTIQQTKAKLDQIYANMAEDNARTAQRIAQIRADSQSYAANVRSNVAANRAAALDHSSQQFSLYMGDQAEYSDPATGQHVNLPSQYGHAWASSTGSTNEYILSDSPSYNPNGNAGGGSWTEMQQVK